MYHEKMSGRLFKGVRMMGISKKYSFAFIACLWILLVPYIFQSLNLSEKISVFLGISTQLCILVITISYLTGQAKIDLTATYGKKDD